MPSQQKQTWKEIIQKLPVKDLEILRSSKALVRKIGAKDFILIIQVEDSEALHDPEFKERLNKIIIPWLADSEQYGGFNFKYFRGFIYSTNDPAQYYTNKRIAHSLGAILL